MNRVTTLAALASLCLAPAALSDDAPLRVEPAHGDAPARAAVATAPPAVPPELEAALTAGPKGTLAVRAIQGTKGGPTIGVADVEVELFHRNQSVRRMLARLDENGMVIVRDVPVGLPVRPVARLRHGANTYQDFGPQMDATHPSASMEVTVYEPTDDPPDWRIAQRVVMIAAIEDGVDVVEHAEVSCPGDRTWMGRPADDAGRRATVVFDLPPGARDVRLEYGFHGWCCTSFRDGRLTVQMPLMPGKSPFKFSYRADAPAGAGEVRVAAPAPSDRVTFLIPDDAVAVTPGPGLTAAGVRPVAGTRVRAYEGAAPPGVPLALALHNMPSASTRAASAGVRRAGWTEGSAPVLVMIGAGVVIVGGALYLFLRPPGERSKRIRLFRRSA